MHIQSIRLLGDETPVALIFGTGDIASAIARGLFLSHWGVMMLRDEAVPVMRRGMAFDDALEDGVVELEGVWGARATAAEMLPILARGREAVVVARLDPAVVSNACRAIVSVLIDARMRKYAAPADLRPLAACAIGVGPGFVAGENVDIAIETLPGQEGDVVSHGPTATPTGRSVPLGGAKEERFACALTAPVPGSRSCRWVPLWRPGRRWAFLAKARSARRSMGACAASYGRCRMVSLAVPNWWSSIRGLELPAPACRPERAASPPACNGPSARCGRSGRCWRWGDAS